MVVKLCQQITELNPHLSTAVSGERCSLCSDVVVMASASGGKLSHANQPKYGLSPLLQI